SDKFERGVGASKQMAADHVDLRPIFEQWGLSPRRQGTRPTCSVFTVVGALELAAARAAGGGGHLSVEFLNWAAHQVARRTADDAGGGAFLYRNSGKEGPDSWMPFEYVRAYMNDALWISGSADDR